jgi:hypothetical protein
MFLQENNNKSPKSVQITVKLIVTISKMKRISFRNKKHNPFYSQTILIKYTNNIQRVNFYCFYRSLTNNNRHTSTSEVIFCSQIPFKAFLFKIALSMAPGPSMQNLV